MSLPNSIKVEFPAFRELIEKQEDYEKVLLFTGACDRATQEGCEKAELVAKRSWIQGEIPVSGIFEIVLLVLQENEEPEPLKGFEATPAKGGDAEMPGFFLRGACAGHWRGRWGESSGGRFHQRCIFRSDAVDGGFETTWDAVRSRCPLLGHRLHEVFGLPHPLPPSQDREGRELSWTPSEPTSHSWLEELGIPRVERALLHEEATFVKSGCSFVRHEGISPVGMRPVAVDVLEEVEDEIDTSIDDAGEDEVVDALSDRLGTFAHVDVGEGGKGEEELDPVMVDTDRRSTWDERLVFLSAGAQAQEMWKCGFRIQRFQVNLRRAERLQTAEAERTFAALMLAGPDAVSRADERAALEFVQAFVRTRTGKSLTKERTLAGWRTRHESLTRHETVKEVR